MHPRLAGGVFDRHLDVAPVQGRAGQGHGRLAPGLQLAPVHRQQAVAGLEPGFGGDPLGLADHGGVVLAPDHEHHPQQGHAQQQVGDRAGGHDRDPPPHALAVEGMGLAVDRHIALALVEHLHVAAQRDGGDGELGAVAVMARPQRFAEAHGKTQHVHPASARHPVVAEFVEGDQHAQTDQQPPQGAEEITHGRHSVVERACGRWRSCGGGSVGAVDQVAGEAAGVGVGGQQRLQGTGRRRGQGGQGLPDQRRNV